MTILLAKKWFKVAKHDKPYTVFFGRPLQTHGLLVKASCSEYKVSVPEGSVSDFVVGYTVKMMRWCLSDDKWIHSIAVIHLSQQCQCTLHLSV